MSTPGQDLIDAIDGGIFGAVMSSGLPCPIFFAHHARLKKREKFLRKFDVQQSKVDELES